MKIKVSQTIEVSDNYRRAINLFFGRPGMATREQVKRWIIAHGSSEDDDLMHDLQQHDEAQQQEAS